MKSNATPSGQKAGASTPGWTRASNFGGSRGGFSNSTPSKTSTSTPTKAATPAPAKATNLTKASTPASSKTANTSKASTSTPAKTYNFQKAATPGPSKASTSTPAKTYNFQRAATLGPSKASTSTPTKQYNFNKSATPSPSKPSTSGPAKTYNFSKSATPGPSKASTSTPPAKVYNFSKGTTPGPSKASTSAAPAKASTSTSSSSSSASAPAKASTSKATTAGSVKKGLSRSSSEGFNTLAEPERLKLATATEQRLYELACKARAKGMFVKIPPSHKRARAVADEMTKFVNHEKQTVVKPLADLSETHRTIKELNMVKTEKLNQRIGYAHVMTVLKEEFQNYSLLAHQRGHDEKGEIFQLISHFPKIGLILQRVNVDRPFRYDGVIDDLADCTHCDKVERVGSLIRNKVRTRVTTPAVKKCKICEQKVVDDANEKLDIMHRKLEEDPGETVDATLRPFPFEKHYKLHRSLLTGQGAHDYAIAIDSLRKIWNLDIQSVEKRESMFKDRIRQQKLTAMVNIYKSDHLKEELEEVVKNIELTAVSIQEHDSETVEHLNILKESFGGSWEKVRKNLGTTSALSSDDRKIRRLQDKLEESEETISKLRRQLEQEKAKNGNTSSKPGPKPKNKDNDKDKGDNDKKRKDQEDDEPSTSTASPAKRQRLQ